MNRKLMRLILWSLTITMMMVATACGKNDDPAPKPPVEDSCNRTVLVYMVAKNNLGDYGYDYEDIAEMKRGVQKAGGLNGGRLLVYHSRNNKNPRLFEIDAKGNEVDVISEYTSRNNSVSIARMQQVINDAQAVAPGNTMALVLWSHGTGWLEDENTFDDPDQISLLSFGSELNNQGTAYYNMSPRALRKALEPYRFDFVYFDCCLMGTVEVMYELREVTSTIVASATELPMEGMPYDRNVPEFLKKEPDLVQAAQNTFNFYNDGFGSLRYCTMTVVDAAKIDRLASATRAIMETGMLPLNGYISVPYFHSSTTTPVGAYDMADYVRALPFDETNRALLDEWNAAFADVVMYKVTTPYSYGLDMSRYNGLGSNIITSRTDRRLRYGYTHLQWWTDVVSHHPQLSF